MERIQTLVIGAGVVGLACAKFLAESGRDVLIVERDSIFGSGTSSRNSEVIHAGIYYPQGSLKAITCVEGRRFLYRYARERGVSHKNCGKLVVATNEAETATLQSLQQKSERNGLTADEALAMLPAERVRELEPSVRCVAALWSPSTGIVDSHSLMLAYLGDAENAGASCVFNTSVERIEQRGDGYIVSFKDQTSGAMFDLHCAEIVNSAGLHAQQIARSMPSFPAQHIPTEHWVKGNYFTLSGVRPPFDRLVYPVPSQYGLGVHYTVDLGGQGRFGPDTEEPINDLNYDVAPDRADVFYAEIRKYWPALPDGALQPGYAGIRPKLRMPAGVAPDFVISGPAQHGCAGLVHLFGIESPGLTGSAAIAMRVVAALGAA